MLLNFLVLRWKIRITGRLTTHRSKIFREVSLPYLVKPIAVRLRLLLSKIKKLNNEYRILSTEYRSKVNLMTYSNLFLMKMKAITFIINFEIP